MLFRVVSMKMGGMLLCVFFFFKQKTAYEMRISDWSSDVCSSDLACSNAAKTAPFNPMKANPRLFSNSLYDKADIPATWIFSGASALAPWAGAANSNHRLAATLLMRCGLLPYPPRLARIGNASCGERVCQYVYI